MPDKPTHWALVTPALKSDGAVYVFPDALVPADGNLGPPEEDKKDPFLRTSADLPRKWMRNAEDYAVIDREDFRIVFGFVPEVDYWYPLWVHPAGRFKPKS